MEQQRTAPNAAPVDELIEEVQRQILAKKDIVQSQKSFALSGKGRFLPPEFYENLYEAGRLCDQMGVKVQAVEGNLPLVGPWIDSLRYKFHELIVFYVNKSAAEQTRYYFHLIQAAGLLAQELEDRIEK